MGAEGAFRVVERESADLPPALAGQRVQHLRRAVALPRRARAGSGRAHRGEQHERRRSHVLAVRRARADGGDRAAVGRGRVHVARHGRHEVDPLLPRHGGLAPRLERHLLRAPRLASGALGHGRGCVPDRRRLPRCVGLAVGDLRAPRCGADRARVRRAVDGLRRARRRPMHGLRW